MTVTSISFQTEIGSIQIQLNPGSTILVAGANGVGKSALLYTLFRSLPQDHATYLPGHRQIYFNSGWDAVGQDAAQLRSNLFMHTDQFSRIKSAWAEDQFKVSIRTLLHAESTYNRDFRILTSQHLYSSEENAALKLSPVDTQNLVFRGARLPVQFILDNSGLSAERDGVVYAIDALSDGERAALFLVAAIVVQSENSVILIDEPEKHLHPSITSLLIEVTLRARPDIITVLSTHDVHLIERLQVAQVIHVRNSRVTSLKPEVRVFDAEILTNIDSISEDLKRELLGSRYKLLFVEGENNSSDLALYSHVYQDFKVSPKGGHEKVSEAVKALKDLTANHWLKSYGIIDGDGRDIKEIRALETHGIHVLKFPSIENLFFQK